MLYCCCVAPMAAHAEKNCHDADFACHYARFCRDRRVGRADAARCQRLRSARRPPRGPRPASLRCRWWPLLELRHEARAPARPRRSSPSRSRRASSSLPLAANPVRRSSMPCRGHQPPRLAVRCGKGERHRTRAFDAARQSRLAGIRERRMPGRYLNRQRPRWHGRPLFCA